MSSISSLGTGDLAGIIVGGVLAIATVIGIALSCYSLFCKKKNPPQVNPYPSQNYQQDSYGRPMNTGYYGGQPYHPSQQQSWGPPPVNDPREQSRGPRPPSYQQDQSWRSPPASQPDQYPHNAPNTKY